MASSEKKKASQLGCTCYRKVKCETQEQEKGVILWKERRNLERFPRMKVDERTTRVRRHDGFLTFWGSGLLTDFVGNTAPLRVGAAH